MTVVVVGRIVHAGDERGLMMEERCRAIKPFLIVGRAASRVDRLPVVPSHHVPRDVTHLRLLVLLLLLLDLAVVRAVPLGVRLRVRTAQLLVVRLVLGVVTVRVVITGCGGRSTVLLRTVRRRARRSVLAAARITRIFAIVWLATSARTIPLRPVATSGAVVLVLVASIVPIAPFVPVAVAIVLSSLFAVAIATSLAILLLPVTAVIFTTAFFPLAVVLLAGYVPLAAVPVLVVARRSLRLVLGAVGFVARVPVVLAAVSVAIAAFAIVPITISISVIITTITIPISLPATSSLLATFLFLLATALPIPMTITSLALPPSPLAITIVRVFGIVAIA
uniref:(northern house mosquito) hypothetical protein n=1 Tax=Culex pipiens TaxID=7175 RepID=A0A8D8GWH3_CULPI